MKLAIVVGHNSASHGAVYDRTPVDLGDGETYTPPDRFGAMG